MGSNPRVKWIRSFEIWILMVMMASQIKSQIFFIDGSHLLVNSGLRSGIAVGVADMNGDFKDDIIRLHEGTCLNIEYQNEPNELFSNYYFGEVSTSSEWSMCIGDIDHNGYNDVLVGGRYDDIKLFYNNNSGTAVSMSTLDNSNFFIQGSNFVDINNDGWLDIFACDDNADLRKYRNLQDGTFIFDQSLIPTNIGGGNSGNYASIWIDYDNDDDLDLYISKCRGGVTDPTSPNRLNRLLRNNGSNVFQDAAGAAGLRIGDQSWSSTFEDIDNDGDLDCFMINHGTHSRLYENDGFGSYTDITASSNLLDQVPFSATQTIMRDFDNDGYVDILISGTSSKLFRNNGNNQFTEIINPFGVPVATFAIGDLNRDGYLDVYAGYPNFINIPHIFADQMWLNVGGANNYFVMELVGRQSNINGIGARVALYYAGGVQIREVRSGESYGIQNSLNQHFGLGIETTIDSVIVKWPSGTRDKLFYPVINQFFRLHEGDFPICPDQYIIPFDPIPSVSFLAQELIQASTTITEEGQVTLLSGDRVGLEPSFEVITGGTLTVAIEDCGEE